MKLSRMNSPMESIVSASFTLKTTKYSVFFCFILMLAYLPTGTAANTRQIRVTGSLWRKKNPLNRLIQVMNFWWGFFVCLPVGFCLFYEYSKFDFKQMTQSCTPWIGLVRLVFISASISFRIGNLFDSYTLTLHHHYSQTETCQMIAFFSLPVFWLLMPFSMPRFYNFRTIHSEIFTPFFKKKAAAASSLS